MKKLFIFLIISLLIPNLLLAVSVKLPDELDKAITSGDLKQVKEIIKKDNALISSVTRLQSTPLILAVFEDQIEIAKFFIDNKADVNAKNRNGSTAIHFAAMNGNAKMVKILMKSGAELNVENNNKRNPLHYAAMSGNIELFEFIHAQGISMDPASHDNSSMLHWACHGGNIDMVEHILEKGISLDVVDNRGYSVLNWAATSGKIDILKYLVEKKGMDVNIKNNTGNTPIHSAAFAKNLEGIKYFISQGADVNAADDNGRTALTNAAAAGSVEVVAALMESGAVLAPKICKESACAESPTALHTAAWNSPNVVEYFIKSDVDVNILDPNMNTALHNAIRRDSVRSVKLLCKAGVNIDQQNKNGFTALHLGAKRDNKIGTKILLKCNADVNLKDVSGMTALHYASAKGNASIIEMLLTKNVNLNEKNDKGFSALDLAHYYGNDDCIKLLANANAKSFNKSNNPLNKELTVGESVVWYLDHAGYAIKTKNNLLIFDYWERNPIDENSGINNGAINPDEIKDLNVTVFASHTHGDHFSQVIFDWETKVKNINYVLGFEHNTKTDYTYIPARETKSVGDVRITPVVSNDSGQGFYVEVDGVTIFHPGDHTNISQDMCPNYTGDVKFLADKFKHTDIAFFPVTGCRFRDKVALHMGTKFALKTMKPTLALPMHGSGNEYEYKRVADDFNKEFEKEFFKYPLISGDRFYYSNNSLTMAK